MNIQDINCAQAQVLGAMAGDLPITLGYKNRETPNFNFKLEPHDEDSRFILPNIEPFSRKLIKKWENDEVLVGMFYVPENDNFPYPLCAQYSMYLVDKKNPGKDYGGGILPSQFPYPPLGQRDKGIDKKDFEKMQNFINEGLKLKGFKTQFPLEDSSKYHIYWKRPEFDGIHPGKIGEDFRAEDGVLRRLEAVFENDAVRVEISSMIERVTEFSKEGYFYSIDVFKNGKCISGQRIQSLVQWPPLRERKFGIDYDDWNRIQIAVNQILDYLEIRNKFEVIDDKEKYCYSSLNKELTRIMVMKKKIWDVQTSPKTNLDNK